MLDSGNPPRLPTKVGIEQSSQTMSELWIKLYTYVLLNYQGGIRIYLGFLELLEDYIKFLQLLVPLIVSLFISVLYSLLGL